MLKNLIQILTLTSLIFVCSACKRHNYPMADIDSPTDQPNYDYQINRNVPPGSK